MARNASGNKNKRPFWGGFALGLLAGLGLSLVVALAVSKNNPFMSGPDQAGATPARQPGAPAESPTYDFYKTLPSNAETGADAAVSTQPPEAQQPQWLQAGAFQHPEEADNLKARLALLGVEAAIESAEIPEKGTLYRVRIGPLKTPEELDATRKRLMDNSIPAELVKK